MCFKKKLLTFTNLIKRFLRWEYTFLASGISPKLQFSLLLHHNSALNFYIRTKAFKLNILCTVLDALKFF